MFQKTLSLLTYFESGNAKTITFSNDYENEDLKIEIIKDKNIYSAILFPKKELTLNYASLTLNYEFVKSDLLLVNGFQSWTSSKEYKTNGKLRGINHLPKKIINHYGLDRYGDYTFKNYVNKKGYMHSYTLGYIRRDNNFRLLGSLNERTGYTIINYHVPENEIVIEKEVEEKNINERFELFSIYSIKGDYEEVFDKYFSLMKIEKPKYDSLTGYTSWYNYYQNINEEIIKKDLDAICEYNKEADLKFNVFQIDDGYQTAIGDWESLDEVKFPGGLEVITKKAKENNIIPGIWLAPFVCERKSYIYQNKKEWLLKDKDGREVYCGCNWSGFFALDFYNEEVREYLKRCFNTVFNKWGFEMVKLDFLYAVALIPQLGKSRGEIMCEAMDFLREITKDKIVLGCGVPLGPSFGKVDFCRIGADVSLDFDDKLYMHLINSERVSTKNTMINSIYRRFLDKRAFLNDTDVFLLRDYNIKLTKKQKENLCFINSLCGSLLFTSDNIKTYDEEKLSLLKRTFENINSRIISVTQTGKVTFKITYKEKDKTKEITINLKK